MVLLSTGFFLVLHTVTEREFSDLTVFLLCQGIPSSYLPSALYDHRANHDVSLPRPRLHKCQIIGGGSYPPSAPAAPAS